MSRLVIFGSGGFGREILALAQARHGGGNVVFCADDPGVAMSVPVIAPEDVREHDVLVVALGDGAQRREVVERFPRCRGGEIIAPSAVIGPDTRIGEGGVFCDFTMITASAQIGCHFQCNIYSYVAHDCVIGDYVTFAPRVACNGNVHIGDGAYIGTGAIIRNGAAGKPLVIGEGAIIGMGAVVTKSVEPGATVVGNPARPLSG